MHRYKINETHLYIDAINKVEYKLYYSCSCCKKQKHKKRKKEKKKKKHEKKQNNKNRAAEQINNLSQETQTRIQVLILT